MYNAKDIHQNVILKGNSSSSTTMHRRFMMILIIVFISTCKQTHVLFGGKTKERKFEKLLLGNCHSAAAVMNDNALEGNKQLYVKAT